VQFENTGPTSLSSAVFSLFLFCVHFLIFNNATHTHTHTHTASYPICVQGTEFSETERLCVQCHLGKYKPDPGNHACTQCAVGKNSIQRGSTLISECRVCPVNSRWSTIVDDTISCLCNAGYAGNDLTGIQSAYSDFSSCVMCDAGKYTDGTNITGCVLCDPGKNPMSWITIK